ncbi:MAG: TetR/AcrR family transcriptional regulator [Solirubrobacteraceae bacterium]
MPETAQPSRRRDELLELAYEYALGHGLGGISLRPLADAIGSSPRVLLFLFGSKQGLLRALLERARRDELEFLERVRGQVGVLDLAGAARAVWDWLAAEEHHALLRLWVEAYAQSLLDPSGPWGGFARATVEDWLGLLAAAQAPQTRGTPDGLAERSLTLAVLRGAFMDLLATGEFARVDAAVRRHLEHR